MTSGLLQVPYNQFSKHDEEKLAELASSSSGVFCEIGCWTGHSTSILAQRAKETNSRLIVIDNFKGNEGTPLFDYAKQNNVIDIFIRNMKELDLWQYIELFCLNSDDAAKFINNNMVDFLFIDAGHTYEQVRKDILNYLPKVKRGAIICGHDYESDTYEEDHINEDYVNGKHHGVIKAVNEVFGKVKHEGRMWWLINEN